MTISQAEVNKITEYLDIQAPPRRAEIAFVFGSMSMVPAQIASELYFEKVVRFIIVTGGINRESKALEADAHREFLLEEGVPENCIIVENKSTNTRENVVFAQKVIEEKYSNVLPIQSVVAVAKWYHSRRAVMTLKRNLPPGIRYYTATYQLHNISRSNWWKNDIGLHYVMKEWNSIPVYLKQDNIAEIFKENGAYV